MVQCPDLAFRVIRLPGLRLSPASAACDGSRALAGRYTKTVAGQRSTDAHVVQLSERIVTCRAGTVTAVWCRHGHLVSVEPIVQRPCERGE
jgi:hypothetical protein